MFDNLLDYYHVFFEGIEEPVFYGHYYPMGEKSGHYKDDIWAEFKYCQGLKVDKDASKSLLCAYETTYKNDLRQLFETVNLDVLGARVGVVVIPSSKTNVVNRVTTIVRSVLENGPDEFEDLTHVVTRIKDKKTAHAGGGRSYKQNFDTIGVDSSVSLARYDVILVIDDILTSGKSFRSMDDKLYSEGFNGLIINFAMGRTFPSEGATCCWEFARKNAEATRGSGVAQSSTAPIEAIVFDLDQTLIDDKVRDLDYEEWLSARDRRNVQRVKPYALYDGIDAVIALRIPFAIVSNRPMKQLDAIILNSRPY